MFFPIFPVLNNEMTLSPKRGRGQEKDQDNWSISAISESSTILPFPLISPPNLLPYLPQFSSEKQMGETNARALGKIKKKR